MSRLAPLPTWFDRVAADVFGPTFAPAAVTRGPRTSARTTPAGLEVRVELPGFAESDVEVTIDGRVLTVAARRTEGAETVSATRRLSVGEGYDLDAVQATYRHGLLTVVVPVLRPASRKVTVTVASAPEATGAPEAPAATDEPTPAASATA